MPSTAPQAHASTGRCTLPLLPLLLLAAAITGCATGPRPTAASMPEPTPSSAPSPDRDGPEADPPPGLVDAPDAEPRLEPIRVGGPNKPYAALGQAYVPMTRDAPFTERGLASWYGRKFHGRRTASGEVYNMYAMTAAHPTLPIPSYARVRNPANGREVVVRVNDRGPFHRGRIVDLSYTAALKLDLLRGVAPVELERFTAEDIRAGAWRRGVPGAAPVQTRTAGAAPVVDPVADPAAIDPGAAVPVATSAAAVVAPTAAAVPDAAPRASTAAARGFWVQLGAFRLRDGAEGLQQRAAATADWLAPLLAVFRDVALFRLQAGPFASRDEARSVAERVREALQLVPVIVERR